MAPHFQKVFGSDPSATMIRQARSQTPEANVEYFQSSAESKPFLPEPGRVDMIVAGQAAHWFDYSRLWPEMSRLLRPGGTFAFWCYKDPVLVDYPSATEVLERYTYGQDERTLGPYRSMPGRRYAQEKLRVVQPPEGQFWDVERVEYEPATSGPRSGEGWCFMERTVTVGKAKAYYRTFSPYHVWKEKFPDEVPRSSGGKGDVMDEMFDQIGEKNEELKNEEAVVRMEWGSGLVMARKR